MAIIESFHGKVVSVLRTTDYAMDYMKLDLLKVKIEKMCVVNAVIFFVLFVWAMMARLM